MTCCAPGVEGAAEQAAADSQNIDKDQLLAAAKDLGDGRLQLDLAVPDVHCATCITGIESSLDALAMVERARVNLSTKRVRITFDQDKGEPGALMDALSRSGHRAFLLEGLGDEGIDPHLKMLTRALAVAGFAAGNIMLFSVSIWSGADETTRNLFHWISALIAIPAVIYSGQPFFRSAWGALRNRRLNMDVPIALAVSLALGMSIFETAIGGEHAYFDASVTLLFFLLIGRTIDHMMRERARGAVKNLARLSPKNAVRQLEDGTRQSIPISAIEPGMILHVAAGDRLPVDATIVSGQSDLDCALVTGESVPEPAEIGAEFLAGSMNLSGALVVRATQPADQSFLARMISLMEAAEGSRAGYRRIADRAAEIYAPLVHSLALISFIGWVWISGDWHVSLLNAMAVLIITCPCALALAVPMVHIVASGRLFERGIMMKDSVALERLSKVDHVVFDKTGTLTAGHPSNQGQIFGDAKYLPLVTALASRSNHPLSRALAGISSEHVDPEGDVREIAGSGLEVKDKSGTWRLGRSDWCGADGLSDGKFSEVWLSHNGKPVAGFTFRDDLREDAKETVTALQKRGVGVTILSGDRQSAVDHLASRLGISDARGGLHPQDKLDAISALQDKGAQVLMVGDGINDAPALRLANVSMAPATAADVGRSAADFVLTRESLMTVDYALGMSQRADRAVKQNFGLAIIYNLIAIPLAVFGFVTPLVAAVAMSGSSIVVTLNALRLRFDRKVSAMAGPKLSTPQPHQMEPAE